MMANDVVKRRDYTIKLGAAGRHLVKVLGADTIDVSMVIEEMLSSLTIGELQDILKKLRINIHI